MRKLFAELFGTYWLVFGGCGSALFAAGYPNLGIGFAGVALAFGLTVLTMAYAVGHISGGHFNPAVTFGLWASGRFSFTNLIPYIIVQCLGAFTAAGTLFAVAAMYYLPIDLRTCRYGLFMANRIRLCRLSGLSKWLKLLMQTEEQPA